MSGKHVAVRVSSTEFDAHLHDARAAGSHAEAVVVGHDKVAVIDGVAYVAPLAVTA